MICQQGFTLFPVPEETCGAFSNARLRKQHCHTFGDTSLKHPDSM